MNNRNISNTVKEKVSDRMIPIYVGISQSSCTFFGFPKDIVGVIGGTMVQVIRDEERVAEEKREREEWRDRMYFGKGKYSHF